ncbi:hypothetical protein M0R45_020979 [Rubus argutus]|uniref:Uncharacterized protein n=1 Tax=Rubus argutus TaxID=59490 RepID=A0AAW1XBW2_RUBAR
MNSDDRARYFGRKALLLKLYSTHKPVVSLFLHRTPAVLTHYHGCNHAAASRSPILSQHSRALPLPWFPATPPSIIDHQEPSRIQTRTTSAGRKEIHSLGMALGVGV